VASFAGRGDTFSERLPEIRKNYRISGSSSENPEVTVIEFFAKSAKLGGDMNTLKRLVFGVLASLLFAAGFASAADRLDPVTRHVNSVHGPVNDTPLPGPSCEDGSDGDR
jgi:hypothetical protein